MVTADQIHVSKDRNAVIIIVPRLPKNLLSGLVNQHPTTAHARYGAELTKPKSQTSTSGFMLRSYVYVNGILRPGKKLTSG